MKIKFATAFNSLLMTRYLTARLPRPCPQEETVEIRNNKRVESTAKFSGYICRSGNGDEVGLKFAAFPGCEVYGDQVRADLITENNS